MKNSTRSIGPNGTEAAAARIRYAVVGLGHIAQAAVLPAFAHTKNSTIGALVSGDARKVQTLKKKYAVPQTFSYGEFDACLAATDIDAVYIALPNDLHCEFARRAAAAGKHILCEKPLATTERQARLMLETAARHRVHLMTAYRLHYEPANLATIEIARSGRIGDPRYYNASFSYQVTDRDNIRLDAARAGGPTFDIGIYCVNAARHFFGDEPREVSAFLTRNSDARFREVEDGAAVILRFPRGRLAAFTISFSASAVSRAELVGTKGRVVLEPAFEYSEPLRQTVTVNEKPSTKTFPHTDQFAGEIEAFSECIRTGKTPEPSAEEGLADLRVIEAIFESGASGRAVRLKPFMRRTRPDVNQVQRKPATTPPKPVRADSPHD